MTTPSVNNPLRIMVSKKFVSRKHPVFKKEGSYLKLFQCLLHLARRAVLCK
jgi:hypothetical protein